MSYFADNFGANGGTNERNYPFFQEVNLVTPTTFTPFRSISDGLPVFSKVALQPTLTPPAGFAVFYIPRHFHEDTVKMWNVGIQREVGWDTMIDLSYVGTRGTNIFRSYNINVPAPGPGAGAPRRPYFGIAPNISTINLRDGDGKTCREQQAQNAGPAGGQAEKQKKRNQGLADRLGNGEKEPVRRHHLDQKLMESGDGILGSRRLQQALHPIDTLPLGAGEVEPVNPDREPEQARPDGRHLGEQS